jgi:hypothetical protein
MKVDIGYPEEGQPQRIDITIDSYDTWNTDHTLANIIVPLLERIKLEKQGAPNVDDEDVPEALRSTVAPAEHPENGETDGNWFLRWDYVLDEMTWAMREIAHHRPTEDSFYKNLHDFVESADTSVNLREVLANMQFDEEGYKAYHARVQRGCVLFGKYFQCLWT